MKPIALLSAAIIGATLAAGCSRKPMEYHDRIQGFEVTVKIPERGVGASVAGIAVRRATRIFEETAKLAGSETGPWSELNEKRRLSPVTPEISRILNAAAGMQSSTSGVWNPFKLTMASASGGDSSSMRQSSDADSVPTSAIHLESGRVELTGDGRLDLKRLSLGCAVDAAVASLQESGVSGGMFRAGECIRYWGDLPDEAAWGFRVTAEANDGAAYRLSGSKGSYFTLDFSRTSGEPGLKAWSTAIRPDSLDNLSKLDKIMAWAPQAASAAGCAEVALILGRRTAMQWAADRDTVGMLYLYRPPAYIAVEADPTMSPWVSPE